MLRVSDGAYRFDQRMIFSQASIELEPESIYFLKGENGAGKTTFLEVIAGVRALSAGMMSVEDSVRTHYIGHKSGISKQLTAYENLTYALAIRGVRGSNINTRQGVESALNYFGIAHLIDLPLAYFSAGQKRKVVLAALLLIDASVLLLDEPYTSLDQPSCALLNKLLLQFRDKGCTVLLTSHVQPQLERLRLLELKDKKLVSYS